MDLDCVFPSRLAFWLAFEEFAFTFLRFCSLLLRTYEGLAGVRFMNECGHWWC